MKKLLIYLKDYKKESMIGPLFKLLEACFELVVPLIMANMIDIGIRNGDTGYILRMGSILILFAVLGLSCSLTAQYFAAKASWGLERRCGMTCFGTFRVFPMRRLTAREVLPW